MADSNTRGVDTRRVALRVPEQVKTAFEQRVAENRVNNASHYAFVLEEELLAELGIGAPGDLVDAVHSLARTHEETDRENNFCSVPDADGGGMPVPYWIDEGLRDRLVNAAERADTVDTAGEYLARIMWRYAEGDGYKSRAAARAGRVEDATRALASDTGAVERRTETIIAAADLEADSRTSFTRGEFREGVAAARGLSTETGVLGGTEQKYLDRVLNRLGYVWIREHTFGDPDEHDPAPLAEKPYEYLTDDEKMLAVKYAALDRARQSHNGWAKFDHAEAKATLDNRLDSATGFMQQVGECDGFSYDSTEEVLKMNADRALDAAENREAVADLGDDTGETTANDHVEGGGSTGETTTPDADLMDEPDPMEDSDSDAPASTATDADGDGWIRDVVDRFDGGAETVAELPDVAIRSAIAKHRHGTHAENGTRAKHRDKVPDSDVTAVRTYAEGVAVSDSSDDETDETGDLEADARDELDALAAGTPANATVATDGGGDDDAGGDDSGEEPPLVADGGTATADAGTTLDAGRTADTLECRSLGCGPCCPACGGQLRETDHSLTVECIRSTCRRRVSLADVVEQIGGGTDPPPDPGD